jgi:hypothetical protein
VDGFVVDSAAMQDNAATFYWNWDMSKNNLLNGKFQGFSRLSILPLSAIFLLDFENVSYFCLFFILLKDNRHQKPNNSYLESLKFPIE